MQRPLPSSEVPIVDRLGRNGRSQAWRLKQRCARTWSRESWRGTSTPGSWINSTWLTAHKVTPISSQRIEPISILIPLSYEKRRFSCLSPKRGTASAPTLLVTTADRGPTNTSGPKSAYMPQARTATSLVLLDLRRHGRSSSRDRKRDRRRRARVSRHRVQHQRARPSARPHQRRPRSRRGRGATGRSISRRASSAWKEVALLDGAGEPSERCSLACHPVLRLRGRTAQRIYLVRWGRVVAEGLAEGSVRANPDGYGQRGAYVPTEMNPFVIGLIAFVALWAALGQLLGRREKTRR